jgi:hypothetical protein
MFMLVVDEDLCPREVPFRTVYLRAGGGLLTGNNGWNFARYRWSFAIVVPPPFFFSQSLMEATAFPLEETNQIKVGGLRER